MGTPAVVNFTKNGSWKFDEKEYVGFENIKFVQLSEDGATPAFLFANSGNTSEFKNCIFDFGGASAVPIFSAFDYGGIVSYPFKLKFTDCKFLGGCADDRDERVFVCRQNPPRRSAGDRSLRPTTPTPASVANRRRQCRSSFKAARLPKATATRVSALSSMPRGDLGSQPLSSCSRLAALIAMTATTSPLNLLVSGGGMANGALMSQGLVSTIGAALVVDGLALSNVSGSAGTKGVVTASGGSLTFQNVVASNSSELTVLAVSGVATATIANCVADGVARFATLIGTASAPLALSMQNVTVTNALLDSGSGVVLLRYVNVRASLACVAGAQRVVAGHAA